MLKWGIAAFGIILAIVMYLAVNVLMGRILPNSPFGGAGGYLVQYNLSSTIVVMQAVGQYLLWKHGKVGLSIFMFFTPVLLIVLAFVWMMTFMSSL